MQLARTHRPQSRNRVLPAASSSVAIEVLLLTSYTHARSLAPYTRANKFAASSTSARATPPFFRFVKMEGTVIAAMTIHTRLGIAVERELRARGNCARLNSPKFRENRIRVIVECNACMNGSMGNRTYTRNTSALSDNN